MIFTLLDYLRSSVKIHEKALTGRSFKFHVDDARVIVELVEAVVALRTAQKEYMADRGNEEKGSMVGVTASLVDTKLDAIIK